MNTATVVLTEQLELVYANPRHKVELKDRQVTLSDADGTVQSVSTFPTPKKALAKFWDMTQLLRQHRWGTPRISPAPEQKLEDPTPKGEEPTKPVNPDGDKEWKKLNLVIEPSDGMKINATPSDSPANESPNSTMSDFDRSVRWYKDGKLHREDGPAVQYKDGTKEWYVNGERHREDGPAIERPDGSTEWYSKGVRSRGGGLPAIERADGTKMWVVLGRYHREGGPAKIWADGGEEWYKLGSLHREDGPAKVTSDGTKTWYYNGVFHRTDGPAIEYADGTKVWYMHGVKFYQTKNIVNIKSCYLNGALHRESGPAIEFPDGTKAWWFHGKLHREDGPAIERADGTKEWWLHGKQQRLVFSRISPESIPGQEVVTDKIC